MIKCRGTGLSLPESRLRDQRYASEVLLSPFGDSGRDKPVPLHSNENYKDKVGRDSSITLRQFIEEIGTSPSCPRITQAFHCNFNSVIIDESSFEFEIKVD